MVFNTFDFLVFFGAFYLLFLAIPRSARLWLILVASLLFYAAWDYRFLALLVGTVAVDYVVGLRLPRASPRGRKALLVGTIAFNLGLLGFFKYYNFFAGSLVDLFNLFGATIDRKSVWLDIILPIGISFHTFQCIAYVVDVYRGKYSPARKFWRFLAFVTFFPQLVAGPIERYEELSPQLDRMPPITRQRVANGVFLIMWGWFLKSFVGDNLSMLVEPRFAAPGTHSGFSHLIGLYSFHFQVLGDFAGYSAMARGLANLMGIELVVNFNTPYWSTNPQQFWQRWHMSLSRWLRDFLYFPLGGNRRGTLMTYRNLFLTMLIGGLWHGANYTFVIWGAYHGVVLIAYRLLDLVPKPAFWQNAAVRTLTWPVRLLIFFNLMAFSRVYFRSDDMAQASTITKALFTDFRFDVAEHSHDLKMLAFFVGPMLFGEALQIWRQDQLFVAKLPAVVAGLIYAAMFYMLVVWGYNAGQNFVYFQF